VLGMRNTNLSEEVPISWNQIKQQIKSAWEEDFYYSRTFTLGAEHVLNQTKTLVGDSKKFVLDVSVLMFVLVIALYIFYPSIANADKDYLQSHLDEKSTALVIESMQEKTKRFGSLPQAKNSVPKNTIKIPISAYTSNVLQTDDTPCITASGFDVCEHGIENIVAANFVPLGSRVRIPELFGNRVFLVEDRMNKRYHHKIDIWMQNIEDARNFGLQYATVEVF